VAGKLTADIFGMLVLQVRRVHEPH
jgi:hypothetical protein